MKGFLGEFIGTFILVFVGCGSVAWAILLGPLVLWQIGLVWGAGVSIGIYASSPLSKGHLNPAVSLGFMLNGDFLMKDLMAYLLGQFSGAFVAAIALFGVFQNLIVERTVNTAMIFGEYYPNPGNSKLAELSDFKAIGVEFLGTFLLMLGIFFIVGMDLKKGNPFKPLLIGILLAILIFFLSPFTQAGFNPARDLSPRIFSYLAGWKMAFSFNFLGWLTVYILAPIIGALTAAALYGKIQRSRSPSK